MSIISQLLGGKISLETALAEVETWWTQETKSSPVAQAVNTAVGAAAGLAGTAFGTAMVAGASAVEGWTNAVLNTVLGGAAAGQLTPSVDLAITTAEQQLVATVNAEVAAFRAKLTPAPATGEPATGAAAP